MSAYELNDEGTVTFHFDGVGPERENVDRTLRRPKLKQYRRLVESLGKMRSALPDIPDEATAEEAAVLMSSAKIDVNEQFDKLLEWLREVFDTLGDGPLPDEDDLPTWVLNGAIPKDLIGHWISVPTGRGAR